MANFHNELTGFPDIWSNIILSVSIFRDEINIYTDNLSKADCPH